MRNSRGLQEEMVDKERAEAKVAGLEDDKRRSPPPAAACAWDANTTHRPDTQAPLLLCTV